MVKWRGISQSRKRLEYGRAQPLSLNKSGLKSALRGTAVRATFVFRQGLWIEDLRTPPGQECSNGSLILLAVVLWRAFLFGPVRWLNFSTFQLLNPQMKLLTVKTVRFADVVEKAGKPEPYTLWQKPGADRHFQSALKNHRVMTIQQSEIRFRPP